MENLGIATPQVRLLSKLPQVGGFVKKIDFDCSAHSWTNLKNSRFFAPLLTESTIDPAGTFAALHPSKRIYWVNNYLADGAATKSTDRPYITWTCTKNTSKTIMAQIVKSKGKQIFDDYTIIQPSKYLSSNLEETKYKGPIWFDNPRSREPDPDDLKTITEFEKWVKKTNDEEVEGPQPEDKAKPKPQTNYVFQAQVRDGLWWGMESSAFLKKNMPFWVHVERMRPPTSADKDTVIVVSIGGSDENNKFDIYLSLNNKPRIIDHLGGQSDVPGVQKEFELEGTRILGSTRDLRIGVMTIGGRLVVLVNGETLVYSRISKEAGDNGGKISICEIAAGSVRIFGTNVQCTLNVSPMTFAPVGVVAVPIPIVAEEGDGAGQVTRFEGVNWKGETENSVCHLPTPPSQKKQLFGCDCQTFSGDGGSASPQGFGFHQDGEIAFGKASDSTFSALPSAEFYTLVMTPSNTEFAGGNLPNGGCPYYFRLKGQNLQQGEDPEGAGGGDITNYIISIDETATAPDYFHSKKSVNITCYNEGGALSQALVVSQSGVEVSWGWDGEVSKTFIGVVTSVTTSDIAGKETCTFHAEDYTYILKNSPIINSPFYDGMVAYYAIKDLAERAALSGFTNDWGTPNDYFLPAGYSFSKPAMRFDSTQKIFDCIMDIVKRFEAFIYFDEVGNMVVSRLPGGLFSSGGSGSAAFTSNPEGASNTVILGERQVEIDFSSTVNCIAAMTLDRDTRNAILYTKTAPGGGKLAFRKVSLLRQAALGELEVCRNYVDALSERVFNTILKTRWKTAGTFVGLVPLDFATVDGKMFRITSVKRNFNAEQNDLTTSYEGEWLGG